MIKVQPLTICNLHCGCYGVRCICIFLDRHVLSDTDALRNPQRQYVPSVVGNCKKHTWTL